jgi:hypothetical protein
MTLLHHLIDIVLISRAMPNAASQSDTVGRTTIRVGTGASGAIESNAITIRIAIGMVWFYPGDLV